jgi:hypothetical protein
MNKYAGEFMPSQGNESGVADFKDYFMDMYGPGSKSTALVALASQNTSSPESNATQAEQQEQVAFGNAMRNKYMKEYAGSYAFPGHSDTFDANGSLTQESREWYANYFKNKYGMGSEYSFGSNGSFNYQQFPEEYLGNGSLPGAYMNKYAGEFMPSQGNESGSADVKDYCMDMYGSGSKATALASSPVKETSPLVLLLCALAGASIPMAFAAAWRQPHLESSEESTGFFLMA